MAAGMRMAPTPNMSTPIPAGWERKNIKNNYMVKTHVMLDAESLGRISFS